MASFSPTLVATFLALSCMIASIDGAVAGEFPQGSRLRGSKETAENEFSAWAAKPLQLGTPVEGRVETRQYQDYFLPKGSLAFPLIIELSSKTGDADLYVSCGVPTEPTEYPTAADGAKWQSTTTGPDQVTIASGDWTNEDCDGATPLIAILGYSNASYTLVAEVGAGPVPLYDNVPQKGRVAVTEYDYWSFDGQADGPVTFTVRSLDGDGDLYVACAGNQPTTRSYVWHSADPSSSDDVVHIEPSDPHWCTDGFVAGVYGFSGSGHSDDDVNPGAGPGVSYVITAVNGRTETNVNLNMPLIGFVNHNEYIYYSVPAETVAGKGVKIVVQPQQDSVDVDLYVSCASDSQLPTSATHRWSSTLSQYQPDSGASDFCPSESAFVIGVLGYRPVSGGSQFSLVVAPASQDLSWIRMPYGERLGGVLTEGRAEYYLLNLGSVKHTSFTMLSGDGNGVTLAVRVVHNSSDARVLPTLQNAAFKKSVPGGSGTNPSIGHLDIDPSSPILAGAYALSVGVFANESGDAPLYIVTAVGNLNTAGLPRSDA